MRLFAVFILMLVVLPVLAEEAERPEITFEQRKAINELEARGGEIEGYLRKDRAITLTLPENLADQDLALIQPILEWSAERLRLKETKLACAPSCQSKLSCKLSRAVVKT